MPRRCRWDPVTLEDATDGRGADALAKPEQLTLQPHISPAPVLPRHPHDQGDDDVVDRWPPGPVRVVHRQRTRRRCQPKIVSGLTRRWQRSTRGSRWTRAANTARSAQSKPDVGWCGAARRPRGAARGARHPYCSETGTAGAGGGSGNSPVVTAARRPGSASSALTAELSGVGRRRIAATLGGGGNGAELAAALRCPCRGGG